MKPKIALIRFPGSNCDEDIRMVLSNHFGIRSLGVWHSETKLPKVEGVILPGGFSYGDYLRSGALAAHAPIMPAIQAFAKRGGAVFGICNGFQILTESGLLPGVLLRNHQQRFICRTINLAVEASCTVKHLRSVKGKLLRLPIAHGDGRYYIDKDGLKRLRGKGQIFVRYVAENGKSTDEANPNGSIDGIAGVASENGRVLGLMPHPERAADAEIGSTDGLGLLKVFISQM